ncbi:Type VI secretion, VasB, ImpH, VC_A0111 [Flavobacterium sp. CF108]|uniref:type VI secretion system baseplate subunit TssG n=1 Tax=unclassified Flavobacterium TaxID=196869 RepID=UPI0008D3EDFB|nr:MULTISPECIES: type VI secretion system baseplate subunit TssG [unclassified Flavobacterium]SEO84763.1 Type VI secretion, VasB, ImpH, VC_A0111 [Flavobacterium sp. fv08]SHG70524.1 Type VI secretion, VasB, ImpH, VC_A0111 [Flavobacterium sp. CF108]
MKTQEKNKKDLENLIQEIESIPYDIRAEIIANELIENHEISSDEISVSNQGQFSRAFRSDVLGAVIQDDNYIRQDYVTLLLSRDSMYDSLPEGFVHSINENNADKSVNQMIKEHKHQKKQENEARNFFNPFENEIFHYRTKIESVERDFLYKLNGSIPLDFFYDFWGLSHNYPAVLVSKFIQLLPYTYKIVGDIDLSCRCLASIIEEKVIYKVTTSKEYSEEREQINLGENRLGVDFICGNKYMDYSMNLTIEIGPIKNNSFENYIHNGQIKRFIDCFYEHFFPMEVEPKTVLIMNQETEEFNFNKQPVLGFTTRI